MSPSGDVEDRGTRWGWGDSALVTSQAAGRGKAIGLGPTWSRGFITLDDISRLETPASDYIPCVEKEDHTCTRNGAARELI